MSEWRVEVYRRRYDPFYPDQSTPLYFISEGERRIAQTDSQQQAKQIVAEHNAALSAAAQPAADKATIERLRAALLGFIRAYANIERLGNDMVEVKLFEAWIRACNELGIRPETPDRATLAAAPAPREAPDARDEVAGITAYQQMHAGCDIQQHPWQAVFGAGYAAGWAAARRAALAAAPVPREGAADA